MARAGDPAVWISWDQSPILRGADSRTAGQGFALAETCELPPGQRLFAGRDSEWRERGYHDGIHSSGRIDDGDAVRIGGSGDFDLPDAAGWRDGGESRRIAEYEVRALGNFRSFG